MKTIRVTYTVKQEYVEQNKANIRQVMEDLRKLNDLNTKYASYLAEDGVTFMHVAQFPDANSQNPLNDLESFSKFRMQLKESQPVVPPKAVNFELVGSGHDIF